MSLSILFWITYAIIFVLGYYFVWEPGKYKLCGEHTTMMLLVGILGWGVYGPIVR